MRPWLPLVFALAGCIEPPAWLDACDCGDDLCVADAEGTSCQPVPAECDSLFADKCDESAKVEVECVVAACGEVTGEWSFEWDCHKNAGGITRYADCTQVDAGTPTE